MTVAPDMQSGRMGGFGLIEILVALAIGATGLLGQALLLQHCLATEGVALRRAQASGLLTGLAEHIRANPAARAEYALPADASPPVAPACADSAGCTPTELAHLDLADWLTAIAATLPVAPAAPPTIAYTPGVASGTDRLAMSIGWSEPGQAEPATLSLSLLLVAPP